MFDKSSVSRKVLPERELFTMGRYETWLGMMPPSGFDKLEIENLEEAKK